MNELMSKQLKFNKKFQYQHFFMRIIFTMLGIFYKWMSNFATERPRTTFLWTKAMVLYDNYCERKIHSTLKSIFSTDGPHWGQTLFEVAFIYVAIKSPKPQ